MANQRLNIIIDAQNKATTAFKNIEGNLTDLKKKVGTTTAKIKNMGPAFKKMSIIGVASLGAVAIGLNKTLQEAGVAEGAMAKFNTVFADGKDEMMDYINTLRKEMPTATTDIVMMASGVQDLLVPMGLARSEAQGMTKEILDLSNKIGAFNDKSPETVLQAIQSGLVGSSEPLKQFGVDARVTTLEQTALSEGLLKVGQKLSDLEPAMKTQITAQALLRQITLQSSDAIEGFEENNDSFLRRQLDLNATLKETRETIGKALLPVMDDLLKKVLPIISKISEWIEENPKLTAVIIGVTVALTALLVIVGLLGLALPPIIAGFGLISLPVLIVIGVIGALIAIGVLLWKNWETIKAKATEIFGAIVASVKGFMNKMKDGIMSVWNAIKNFFQGIFDFIFGIFKFFFALYVGIVLSVFEKMGIDIFAIWESIKTFFVDTFEWLKELFTGALEWYLNIWISTWEKISAVFSKIWEGIKKVVSIGLNFIRKFFLDTTKPILDAWSNMWDGVSGKLTSIWDGIKDTVKAGINWIIDKMNWFIRKANAIASKGAGAVGISIPQIGEIPRLAEGGIVRRPTIAMIGEAGPEAVVPLGKNGGGIGGNVVNINGGTYLSEDVAEEIGNMIIKKLRFDYPI